ncbi:tRNA (guanosine(46)-N7)-methyltransferase TrmB [Arsenophonus symbiont of Ornithomya chloropus]|uniref:tRNA (guanosine(46)-N7)-methyltransferase TrmB n=1 Tax=Arsenophonus symbiont of Ornithomya chloropus TaxID=634121 RepID=UPI0032B2BDCA
MTKNIFTENINTKKKIKHRIRSFVRRQSRLTNNQRHALEILWPQIGLNFFSQPLVFSKIFGNRAPVIMDIGFGMGIELVTMAKKNPNKNFLGIEVYKPGIGACLIAATEMQITNLRIMYYDAVEILEKMLTNNTLNMIQLFFPDPWPKKKHQKRRIIQKNTAKLILDKLEIGGILHITTDCQSYAEHILKIITEIHGYKNLSTTDNYIERPHSRPFTKFEKRGKKLGNTIFDIMFKKIK